MIKKLGLSLIVILVSIFPSAFSDQGKREAEKGTFAIYFMEEKVGYEEYTWQEDGSGFVLTVEGRMTKPIPIEIDNLTIRIDKSYIATHFSFKGTVSGMPQEVSSFITEGRVENTILVAGQKQISAFKIKRDSFLLPNPIFSPYVILTKKFGCSLQEKIELSAYIIPQRETSFTLESKEDAPCFLLMQLDGTDIEIETDEQGNLKALHNPNQRLKVILSQ